MISGLFVITFYQLALYHTRLQHLEQTMAYQPHTQDSQYSADPLLQQQAESVLRYVRTADPVKGSNHLLYDYLLKIAELQVSKRLQTQFWPQPVGAEFCAYTDDELLYMQLQSLKASCAEDKRVCIQGMAPCREQLSRVKVFCTFLGSKGDTGSKGDDGTPGVAGSLSLLYELLEEGLTKDMDVFLRGQR